MADEEDSPLEWALAQVGDRWSLLVVHALLGGAKRFGELSEAVPGIAPNILSRRLKSLEQSGIVVSEPYSSRPPRFAYDLTAAGRELAGALRLLAQWGATRSGEGDGVRHSACGSVMEARWWCPTCERTVDEAEGDDLRFV
ncbi:MAG TPA: helix-turn-helix domain-containing protein [Acidimicrobiales bacterium]|nr:helix-turn-helix domain-containing protein [Acidimicrobiales bacterium]